MFIPCACLNSVVSGLFSRTVLKTGVIQPDEFHGAAYFGELAPLDRTYEFITAIEAAMTYGEAQLPPPASGNGLAETREIAEKFGVPDIKLVKPGIGETTRVLLRRIRSLYCSATLTAPLPPHIRISPGKGRGGAAVSAEMLRGVRYHQGDGQCLSRLFSPTLTAR